MLLGAVVLFQLGVELPEGLLHLIGAGIVLTGGGALMNGVCELVESLFGLPCSVGKPRHVSGLDAVTGGPQYATVSGLVQYGFKTAREEDRALPLPGWLKSLFAR